MTNLGQPIMSVRTSWAGILRAPMSGYLAYVGRRLAQFALVVFIVVGVPVRWVSESVVRANVPAFVWRNTPTLASARNRRTIGSGLTPSAVALSAADFGPSATRSARPSLAAA